MNTDVQPELVEEASTEAIIGAAMDVSNELGAGFLESVYEKALVIALTEKGLAVRAQAPLEVYYRGHLVGQFYADILVAGRVIVEIKAAKALTDEHKAQLMNYLRATGYKVGLLFNFGKPRLEWKRVVFS